MTEHPTRISREAPPRDPIDQAAVGLFFIALVISWFWTDSLPVGDPTRRLLAGCLMLFFVVSSMIGACLWIWSRSRRGRVLLDGKYQPQWRSSLATIALFLGFLVLGSSALSFFEELFPHADLAFGLLLALGLTVSTFTRFQVLSNGLWCYGAFDPWENIESWGWRDESRARLAIQLRRKLPLFRRREIPIRREWRDEVERLLAEHLEQD